MSILTLNVSDKLVAKLEARARALGTRTDVMLLGELHRLVEQPVETDTILIKGWVDAAIEKIRALEPGTEFTSKDFIPADAQRHHYAIFSQWFGSVMASAQLYSRVDRNRPLITYTR